MNLTALIAPVRKAVAAAIITAIVGFIAKYGFTLTPDQASLLDQLVTTAINAAVGFITVYFAPKNTAQ